jgi:hypothetical protein
MNRTYNRLVDLFTMPARIRELPISPTGFPVPWFVCWFEDGEPCSAGYGTPDFRIVDTPKMAIAISQTRCWICGSRMGAFKTFCIGPMCAISRTISEPPSHRDCAIWAAKNCPFLNNPSMRRNEKGMVEDGELRDGLVPAAGQHIDRNPGAVCVWTTKTFKPFRPHAGNSGVLFQIGDPTEVLWFARGRRAKRQEVLDSIQSGYPILEGVAWREGKDAVIDLEKQRDVAMRLIPME